MGKRFVEVTEFKTKKDWANFMKNIADERYPKAKKIILVMGNFKTHSLSAFYEIKHIHLKKRKGCVIDLNSFLPQNMEAG
jgi:cobalamin biosynthesis Co2+ chelatase CbiK